MSNTVAEDKILTPANIVTLVRIAFIPVFYFLAVIDQMQGVSPEFQQWSPYYAALFFVALSATDCIDGYLARSRNEITTFGKFIDPIADKILVVTALIILVGKAACPPWIALVIVVREFIISGLRMVAGVKGVVIPASWYGKWKTVFTMIALTLYLIKDASCGFVVSFNPYLQYLAMICMAIAVILTIWSCIDYFAKSYQLVFHPTQSANKDSQLNLKAPTDQELHDVAKQLIELAKEKSVKISAAESCTGGMIASLLCAIPGASEVSEEHTISYSNRIKTQVLKVPADLLAEKGAVCAEVAEAMARGAHALSNARFTLSTTGVAGPASDEKGNPVGLVYFSYADNGRVLHTEFLNFTGTREEIRRQASLHALRNLYKIIEALD